MSVRFSSPSFLFLLFAKRDGFICSIIPLLLIRLITDNVLSTVPTREPSAFPAG